MATALYAALTAILLVILSARVIALRGSPVFAWFTFGYKGENALDRAIRGHGNLIEYAPMFFLLMFVAEQNGYSSLALHYYGGMFLLGRILHGVCFGFMEKNVLFRVAGTVITLGSILGLSTVLLFRYFNFSLMPGYWS